MPSNPACSAARARSVMVPNDIRICGRYSQNSGDAMDVMAVSLVATKAGRGRHSAILIYSSYDDSVDHETRPVEVPDNGLRAATSGDRRGVHQRAGQVHGPDRHITAAGIHQGGPG